MARSAGCSRRGDRPSHLIRHSGVGELACDHGQGVIHEPVLLADWRDIMQRLAREVGRAAARDHPGGKVRRREAAAGGGDVAMRG